MAKIRRVDTLVADIEVEVNKIRHGARPDFENLFGRYAFDTGSGYQGMDVPAGTIKNMVLRHGVKSLTVEGKKIKLNANAPARSLDSIDEEILDKLDEEEIDLYQELLKLVVAESKWLGQKEPFSMVLGQYLPEESEKSDPTEVSSSTGSTSGLGTPEI